MSVASVKKLKMVVLSFLLASLAFVNASDFAKLCCSKSSPPPTENFKSSLVEMVASQKSPDKHLYYPYTLEEPVLSKWCELNFKSVCTETNQVHTIANPLEAFIASFFLTHQVQWLKILIHDSDKTDLYGQYRGIVKSLMSQGIRAQLVLWSDAEQLSLQKGNFAVLFRNVTESLRAFKQYEEAGLVTMINIWLIRGSITSAMVPENLRLRLDSQVYFYQEYDDSHVISIKEIYRVANHLPLKVNAVGVWSKRSGLLMTQDYIWARRQSLDGLSFTCAANYDPPYVIHDKSSATFKMTGGYSYELWLEIAGLSNITTTFVESIDGVWGVPLPNGSFNGMIGMLERREIDCAIAGLGLFEKRVAVADPLHPNIFWRTAVFTNYASWTVDGALTYVIPFTGVLYILIVATIFVTTAGLFITTYFGRDIREDYHFTFGLDAMITLHGLLNQGAPYEPQKISSRIIFCWNFYAGLIIVAAFSASLTSILAVQKNVYPFLSFDEFYKDSPFKMIGIKGSGYTNHFRLGEGTMRKIYEDKFVIAENVKDGLQKVAEDPSLAYYSGMLAIYAHTKSSCQIRPVPGLGRFGPMTLYVSKNSSYVPLLNYNQAKVMESGNLHKLMLKWMPKEPKNCLSTDAKVLGMDRLFSLFGWMAFALAVALILGLCEMVVGPTLGRNALSGLSHRQTPIADEVDED